MLSNDNFEVSPISNKDKMLNKVSLPNSESPSPKPKPSRFLAEHRKVTKQNTLHSQLSRGFSIQNIDEEPLRLRYNSSEEINRA